MVFLWAELVMASVTLVVTPVLWQCLEGCSQKSKELDSSAVRVDWLELPACSFHLCFRQCLMLSQLSLQTKLSMWRNASKAPWLRGCAHVQFLLLILLSLSPQQKDQASSPSCLPHIRLHWPLVCLPWRKLLQKRYFFSWLKSKRYREGV